uniref:Uncharacterized protein n=1 Tax=Glossina palpalis gambiensis TaxID=67801 RepID=A0A1B0BVP6_9MUSC
MHTHTHKHACAPKIEGNAFLRIKLTSLRSIREHSSHEKLEATLLKETLLQFLSLCSSMNELTTLRPCRWCSTEGCVDFLPNLNYQCIKLEIYAYFEQNEIDRRKCTENESGEEKTTHIAFITYKPHGYMNVVRLLIEAMKRLHDLLQLTFMQETVFPFVFLGNTLQPKVRLVVADALIRRFLSKTIRPVVRLGNYNKQNPRFFLIHLQDN